MKNTCLLFVSTVVCYGKCALTAFLYRAEVE